MILISVSAVISALAYFISAFLSGLYGGFALLITSVVYGMIQYLCLRSPKILDTMIKVILTAVFVVILIYPAWHYGWFYKAFIGVYADYGSPNAGSGFGFMLSLIFNAVIFVIVSIISFCKGRFSSDK